MNRILSSILTAYWRRTTRGYNTALICGLLVRPGGPWTCTLPSAHDGPCIALNQQLTPEEQTQGKALLS